MAVKMVCVCVHVHLSATICNVTNGHRLHRRIYIVSVLCTFLCYPRNVIINVYIYVCTVEVTCHTILYEREIKLEGHALTQSDQT